MAEAERSSVIINGGIRALEARECRLCGRPGDIHRDGLQDVLFGTSGEWKHRFCARCDLVWIDPYPIPEDVPLLYRTYFTHSVPEEQTLRSWSRLVDATALHALGYSHGTGKLATAVALTAGIRPVREAGEARLMGIPGPASGRRLLDVGCGNGRFLARMRDLGWDVEGVEPDERAASVARDQFGLRVMAGNVEDANYPDCQFDVVTANHVFEHLWDPVMTLRECRRILKPDGQLVLVTPNSRSLGAQTFGRAWLGWDAPRHLTVHSSRSLRLCGEAAGFRVTEQKTLARKARRIWRASEAIRRRRNTHADGSATRAVGIGAHARSTFFWLREHMAVGRHDVGEELRLVATLDQRGGGGEA